MAIPRLARKIAWQGISLRVPEDWNLAAVRVADGKHGGYLRLDDADMPRLECRWAAGSPRGVARAEARLRQQVEKTARAARASVVWEKPTPVEHRKAGDVVLSWQAAIRGTALIRHCGRCGRLAVVQVYSGQSDAWHDLAPAIFAGFRDHHLSTWQPWSVYDFRFSSPKGFALHSVRLLSGHLWFRLCNGRECLQFCRWSAGQVRLRDRSLQDWVRDELRDWWKGLHIDMVSRPIRGDVGMLLAARSRGLRRLSAAPTEHTGRWLFWRCRGSRAIYAVGASVSKARTSLLEQCVERVQCH